MELAVSSYSFSKLQKKPVELLALAKEIGFAGIEFLEMDAETAAQIREESERLQFPIVCYAVHGDFLDTPSVEAEAERLQQQVEIAKILGTVRMRHDATPWGLPRTPSDFLAVLPQIAQGCRWVTEYAAAQGVQTLVENHGLFCQDSDRMVALAHAVGHGNFGLLADIGNFLCADEPPQVAVGKVAPFCKHVHTKDFHFKAGTQEDPGQGWFRTRSGNLLRGAILGHGEVPVRQCIEVLKRFGYNGYLSVEFEGLEDCQMAVRAAHAFLQTML